MLQLFQAEWCPYSHQVRLRLTELGIDWIARQVPADRHDRQAMRDETGLDGIPTLVLEDGAVISGTEAILAALDERYQEPAGVARHRVHARADAPFWIELWRGRAGGAWPRVSPSRRRAAPARPRRTPPPPRPGSGRAHPAARSWPPTRRAA